MSELRRTPMHRALHRPHLILGGERELVLSTLIVCGGLGVSSLNVVSAVVALAVWLVSIGFLRMMAKSDPHMSKVYQRQLQYGTYLPPRSTPFRTE